MTSSPSPASERELLEQAAKAAALPLGTGLGEYAWCDVERSMVRANANGSATAWNPLEDDGDALRLAVRLRLQVITTGSNVVQAVDYGGPIRRQAYGEAEVGDDRYAATRLAIVRAAAAIAKEPRNG